MKKQLLLSLFAFIFGTFITVNAQAPVCGGMFTDPAGPNVNYANSSNVTTTICPSNPGEAVTVNFTSFALENNYDRLRVYDGPTAAAPTPLLANLTGTTLPGAITALNPTGCLTFVFTSDTSINAAGWIANVTCAPLPTCPTPSNIFVSNVTGTSATVGWTDSGSATQWEIIVLPAGAAPSATSTGVITSVNPYTVSGLNPGANSIYVRAICSPTDVSLWSYGVTATTATCTAPTQLTATGITQNSASLSWSNLNAATSWEVAVQLSIVATIPTSGTPVSSNTNYLASGLLAGTSYKYYVRVDCGNGTYSPWSTPTTFTTLAPPLTTPACGDTFVDNGGLTANYFNGTDSTVTIYPTTPGEVVTVTFNSFDTETNWDGLYVYNGNSTSAQQIASSNLGGNVPGGLPGAFWGTTIPGPFTSTSADGSLTFRFRSDSSVNRPGWNATVSCGPAPTCPSPTNASISSITFTSANITWTEMGSATQWEVLVLPATAPAPTATSTGTIVSTNTYQATGLTLGTAYKVYVRAICSSTDISNWSYSTGFTTASCTPPVSMSATAFTTSGATITWTNSAGAQWEILVLPSGSPAPTAATTGIPTNINTYIASGLSCGTTYKVYLRSICANNLIGAWSTNALTFTTSACQLTTGQPVNMTQCSDAGSVCFNLTDNDATILGNLSATEYTISYYNSLANANAQTNPLASPYCLTNVTQTIYAVLVQNSTLVHQTLTFTVTAQSVLATSTITNLDQCDTDMDGSVIFDLTSQVTSSNPLAYYTSLANATSETNAITNPSTYSIAATSPSVTIFIRETVANACDNVYSFQIHAYSNCNLAYNCDQANSLCGSLGNPFANTHQGIQAEAGNSYGCLYSTPNPTWFYLPVSNAGTINLTVQQNASIDMTGNSQDVDYVVYGPFTNPVSPCSAGLTQANIVSCSYSSSAIEHPVIANAQVGQYYLLMTTNFSNQAGYISITMDAASTGAIDCSGMRLNAFLDTNNNGTQEAGEQNFPLGQFHYEVNNDGNVHNVTAPSGVYNIYDITGTNSYDLSYTINPAYTSMYSLSTSSYNNVNVVIGGGMVTYNFPITNTQNYHDVSVAVIPVNSPRAGTYYQNKIVYTNLGNQTIASGMLTFNNSSATTITSISQSGTTAISNGFTYNYTNLLPFESRMITVTIWVPAIPTVAIGQLLTNTASIDPTTDDVVLINNVSSLSQPIIAAYDPNDKIESHGREILFSSFSANDYLTYTIRFENTGNASAINVRVADVLDPRIDETSIAMIDASHPYTMDRVSSNLIWTFENIQLPVSVENTEIGKGHITFKAKLKPGFAIGDIIPNTAEIFFDSNPAIVTNTFETEFVAALGTIDFNDGSFVLYPNPSNEVINIRLNNATDTLASIAIFDLLGKQVKSSKELTSSNATINVSDLSKGVYMVEILTNSGLKQNKKLIIK